MLRVSESAQGCSLTVDVSGQDCLQTHAPAAGRARPALLPPELAGSYQLWQLSTELTTCGASCGFLRAFRRGIILLLRARIGHSHLDLNVGGCVAFRICSLLKLTLRRDQNSQLAYTAYTRREQLPSPAFGALKGETHHGQLGWAKF